MPSACGNRPAVPGASIRFSYESPRPRSPRSRRHPAAVPAPAPLLSAIAAVAGGAEEVAGTCKVARQSLPLEVFVLRLHALIVIRTFQWLVLAGLGPCGLALHPTVDLDGMRRSHRASSLLSPGSTSRARFAGISGLTPSPLAAFLSLLAVRRP